MAHPVKLGQIVNFKSSLVEALKPAVVAEIPLLHAGGIDNADADGNPFVVNLVVLGMQGQFVKYHVPHVSSGHYEYWQELDD